MAPSVRSPVIHNLVEMHMYLMAFAWLIAAPIAIAIAIYGRFFKVKWWVKAHMLIMGFGVGLPFSVAAIAGMVASHGFKPRPHMVIYQNYITFEGFLAKSARTKTTYETRSLAQSSPF